MNQLNIIAYISPASARTLKYDELTGSLREVVMNAWANAWEWQATAVQAIARNDDGTTRTVDHIQLVIQHRDSNYTAVGNWLDGQYVFGSAGKADEHRLQTEAEFKEIFAFYVAMHQ